MPFHLVELTSSEMTCAIKGTLDCRKIKTLTQVLPDQKAGAGQGILHCSGITAEKEKKKNAW